LNRRQQIESERIFASKQRTGFARNDKLHIGYFSGTPSHNRDFEVAVSALKAILDKHPQVCVRTVGFLNPKDFLPGHRDRLEIYPLQDFLNLQALIGEVEINIAPLQANIFTNCKSELKYFESAIVGTLTVSSSTYTLRRAIRDGENGFIANAHEWDLKLQEAIQTVMDRARYMEIVEKAFYDARQRYAWNGYASRIASALFDDLRDCTPADTVEAVTVRPSS
jgi:glycosyltransferase involved in cell wall biosynthesis